MSEKTQLEKSHSKKSNAILTLICLLTALFLGLFVVSLSYYFVKETTILLIVSIVSGVLTLLGTLVLLAFKR